MPKKYHIRKAETWTHSYKCGKYTGLVDSNWNCQVSYNCLVKTRIYFDRIIQFRLFIVGYVSFQDSL